MLACSPCDRAQLIINNDTNGRSGWMQNYHENCLAGAWATVCSQTVSPVIANAFASSSREETSTSTRHGGMERKQTEALCTRKGSGLRNLSYWRWREGYHPRLPYGLWWWWRTTSECKKNTLHMVPDGHAQYARDNQKKTS